MSTSVAFSATPSRVPLMIPIPSSDPCCASAPLDMGSIAPFPRRRWMRTPATSAPMRNHCFAVGETRPRSGSSRLCPTAWHGVHPSLSRSARHSAPRLRVSPKSLPALRKVVPSIRAGVSIRQKSSSSAPAGHHVSAWHGVLRSEIRRQKPEIGTRTAEGPRPSGPAHALGEDAFWLPASDFCRLTPAGHGVDRSFLRLAPRPAAAPSPDLT
jgi:hypothetical protein